MNLVEQVARAVRHPLATFSYSVGLARGFAISMFRVAAGEQGPLLPGHLPGPIAAPIEENVGPDDIARVIHLHPERRRWAE